MTDWKQIAQARGIDIPAEDLDRTLAPLRGLEESFRPLTASLTPEDEPASIFTRALEATAE